MAAPQPLSSTLHSTMHSAHHACYLHTMRVCTSCMRPTPSLPPCTSQCTVQHPVCDTPCAWRRVATQSVFRAQLREWGQHECGTCACGLCTTSQHVRARESELQRRRSNAQYKAGAHSGTMASLELCARAQHSTAQPSSAQHSTAQAFHSLWHNGLFDLFTPCVPQIEGLLGSAWRLAHNLAGRPAHRQA